MHRLSGLLRLGDGYVNTLDPDKRDRYLPHRDPPLLLHALQLGNAYDHVGLWVHGSRIRWASCRDIHAYEGKE